MVNLDWLRHDSTLSKRPAKLAKSVANCSALALPELATAPNSLIIQQPEILIGRVSSDVLALGSSEA